MTVLITGAGLIGAMTAEMLAAQGKTVVLVDLGTPRENAPTGVVVRQCDVTDQPRLDAIVREHVVTEIVHTAAMLSTGIRQDPVRGVQVNVVGTANILEVARKNSIGRVVCASSTTVGYTAFGRRDAQPVTEDLPLHLISERPASIYAMTKIANEQLGLLYHDLYGLDVVLLRYGAVLGGDLEAPTSVPGRLLARLVEAGRTGKRLTLDDPFLVWDGKEEFVDARDCAAANLAALAAAAPKQRVYNVAPGTWVTIGEFIAAVRTVFPALTVDETPRTGKGFAGFPFLRPAPSDIQAAAVELGFRCRYGLADSVRYWAGKQ